MAGPHTPHRADGPHRLGLLLAVLALASQLALGATILPDARSSAQVATQIAALARLGVWCVGGHHPSQRTPLAPHAAGDPALRPLAVSLWLPVGAMPPTGLSMAPRPTAAAPADQRPPGRGPPAATARVGPPRAPPILA